MRGKIKKNLTILLKTRIKSKGQREKILNRKKLKGYYSFNH